MTENSKKYHVDEWGNEQVQGGVRVHLMLMSEDCYSTGLRVVIQRASRDKIATKQRASRIVYDTIDAQRGRYHLSMK